MFINKLRKSAKTNNETKNGSPEGTTRKNKFGVNKTVYKLCVSNYLKSFITGFIIAIIVVCVFLLLKYSLGFFSKTIWWLILLAYVTITIIILYFNNIWLIIKSFRVDIYFVFIFGFGLFYVFREPFTNLILGSLNSLDKFQLLTLLLIPLVFLLSYSTYYLVYHIKTRLKVKNNLPSNFLNDCEIKYTDEDKFDFKDRAQKFAENLTQLSKINYSQQDAN